MNTVTSFDELITESQKRAKCTRVTVVCATDESTLTAIQRAIHAGIATAILVGGNAATEAFAAAHKGVRFIPTATPQEAAAVAVRLVRAGEADVLMKGLVSTDVLLRAVLDKEAGLLPAGAVLTHLTLAALPHLNRLLLFTDAAVIPYPTPAQREAQVRYATTMARAMGIAQPRIALVHCSEKASKKFPHTLHYAQVKHQAEQGEYGAVIVDGPLDVRTACDAEALRTKGISSPLEGKADVLVFPDIEAANTFYKTITFFLNAPTAGCLVGTIAPVVLPSRGDSAENKFLSIALAATGCAKEA